MSNYNYNTLCHHGIKGQKWGIRRFQNEDGTLTAEGRKRYDVAPSGEMTKEGYKLYKKDAKMQNIATKPQKESSTASKVTLGAVMGMGLGAAAGYVMGGPLQFIGDNSISGKQASDLAGKIYAVPGALIGGLLGGTGGAIYSAANKKRVAKAKEYINNLS